MKLLHRLLLYFLTALSLSFVFSLLYLYLPQPLKSIDNLLRDTMFIARGSIEENNNVVIVDIDNRSLARQGHWPWSRDVVAKLITQLNDAGVGLVAMDIIFAEEDASSPKKVLEKIGMPTQGVIDYDVLLAQTLAGTPTILGYQFALEKEEYTKQEFPLVPAIFIKQNNSSEVDDYITKAYGTLLNIPLLQENAYSSGFVNNIAGSSGIVRSIPLIIEYDGAIYPSLSLEIIRAISGERLVHIDYSPLGMQQIRVGDFHIPTNVSGHAYINFRGEQKTFTYISAIDVLEGRFSPEDVEGKIVLIGTSASGLLDLRATVFDATFPGVEVHANLIDNILSEDYISIPQLADTYNILHIIALTFITVFSMAFAPALLVLVLLVVILFADAFLLYTLLFSEGMILNIFVALVSVIVSSLSVILVNNLFISSSERQAKAKVQEVQKAKKQIEGILSSILMPLLVVSKKRKTILYANDYAAKQYGMQGKNLTSLHMDEVYKDEQQEQKIEAILEKKGLVENIEEVFTSKEDTQFTALLSVVPLNFADEPAHISMLTDITKQKNIEKEIRRLHTHTQESIEFASLIQGALLPDETLLDAYFDESFCIWRPRDIVGGDIYLVDAISEDEVLVMVIDGAGHGVPGAFVTMLIKAIATQIVSEIQNKKMAPEPHLILSFFNKAIKTMLKQEKGSQSNTGFDGGVMYYNKAENLCMFAGAKIDLYKIINDDLEIVQGDRKNVGFVRTKYEQEYTNHTFSIEKETRLYMCTDGIIDQEGEHNTRFDDALLEKILFTNNLKEFATQKDIINDSFNNFKQDCEQSDDMTIIGVKIKRKNGV